MKKILFLSSSLLTNVLTRQLAKFVFSLTRAKTDRLGDPHKYSRPGAQTPERATKANPIVWWGGGGVSVVFLLWEAIMGSLSYLRHPNT
ncbi:hypothetical protein CEXT_60331 [Caerostris extrusa]|uniref:Uncharacterized protein n=1 Tax=Caerostris extrusa TaxID=172846 RepID=A0AAV4XLH8_CAEEX|nr:hypothetical protein CEXT_60331 [Caerostris extrusa]